VPEPEPQRLKVFVSSAAADMDARELRTALSSMFDVSSSDTLVGSYARHTALRRALGDVDVVVVFVPPPEDAAARNVLIEAGVALGSHRPVLLVGERAHVPADLAALPVSPAVSARALAADIELVAAGGSTASLAEPTPPASGPGLTPQVAEQLRRRLSSEALTEAEAVGVLDDLFRATGARTKNAVVIGHPPTDRADLAVWHDELTATFGTPLPVEVLARSRSWPAVQQRLTRTLELSGGRTLVALYLGPVQDVPRRWTDGRGLILVAAAVQLLDELAHGPLAVALTRLLERAEP